MKFLENQDGITPIHTNASVKLNSPLAFITVSLGFYPLDDYLYYFTMILVDDSKPFQFLQDY